MTNNTNPAALPSDTHCHQAPYALHPITHNCDDCFDYAGHENTHSDDGHEQGEPIADCRVCQQDIPKPLKNRVPSILAASTHLNHAACYAADLHTKDREGRQHCRDNETWRKA